MSTLGDAVLQKCLLYDTYLLGPDCDQLPLRFSGIQCLLTLDYHNKIIWKAAIASRYADEIIGVGFQTPGQWETLEAIADSGKYAITSLYEAILGSHGLNATESRTFALEFNSYTSKILRNINNHNGGHLLAAVNFIEGSFRDSREILLNRMYIGFRPGRHNDDDDRIFQPIPPKLIPLSALLKWNIIPRFDDLTVQELLHEYEEGDEYIFFSHSWESVDHPDPSGLKLKEIQNWLRDSPPVSSSGAPIKYAWIDFVCTPQVDNFSDKVKQIFSIRNTVMRCTMLKLIEGQTGNVWKRAWCCFEYMLAWALTKSGTSTTQLSNFRLDELSCNKRDDLVLLAGLLYFHLGENITHLPWLFEYSARMATLYVKGLNCQRQLEQSVLGASYSRLSFTPFLSNDRVMAILHPEHVSTIKHFTRLLQREAVPAVTPAAFPLTFNPNWKKWNPEQLNSLIRSEHTNEEACMSVEFHRCASCGWGGPLVIFRCGRCRKVYYCNQQCQRAGWKQHKPNCV